VTASDRLEGGGQVGRGIDAVHLGRLDQRSDPTPIAGTFVVAGEQGVLAGENQGTNAILDRIGVDLDPAVVEEDLQPLPVVGEVGQLLASAGLRRQLGAGRGEPGRERQDQGLGLLLPHGPTPLERLARDLGLDPVELGDPTQALLGDRRGIPVEQQGRRMKSALSIRAG
jgi:hypothetical protein